MSIDLHCPGCTKLIRAPDDAGGRTGKCPYCSRKVYIPMPKDEIETIPIAPLDPVDEAREEELRRESANYAATVSGGGDGSLPLEGDSAEPIDFEAEVSRFITSMHSSDLEVTEQIVARLSGQAAPARAFIESVISNDVALSVDGVPAPLVQGFLKSLLSRLG
ncbi:MAG: hypothetical protein ACPGXK_01815 [Phycisphaerae bacterium]